MTWKKTWFSRICWVCQLAITVLFLTGVSGIFLDKYGIAEKYNILPGYNRLIWLGIIGVLFLVLSLLVFLILRLIVGRLGRLEVKKTAKIAVEVLLLVGLFAGGLLYRFNVFTNTAESNPYFELAAVNSTGAPAPLAHGALYMYILLLHGLFLIVGNNLLAGIILQMVLHFAAATLIYFAVRKMAGVIPSLLTFGLFMFAPVFVKSSFTYSPENLYLLLFSIVLLILAAVLKIVKNTEVFKWYHYVTVFLFGICVSFMIYLDVVGSVLLVVCISMLGIYQQEKIKTVLLLFLTTVLGAVLGLLGIFGVDALQSGSNLTAIAGVWQWLYIPEGGTPFSYLYHQLFLRLSDNLIVSILIFAGMTLGIYGFFLEKKKESQAIWILMTVSGIALSYVCPASGNMDRSFIGLLGMFILAGKGVQLAISAKKIEAEIREDIMVEETVAEENMTEENMTEENMTEENVTEETVEEETVTEEIVAEETSADEAPPEEIPAEETFAEEVPPVKEIKYIENPLPLPKKHVKKTMDYAFEVSEEQMEFDIEIADDDDFDF